MAKRFTPMPLAVTQEETALAVVLLDAAAEAGQAVVEQSRGNGRRGRLLLNGQREKHPDGVDKNRNAAPTPRREPEAPSQKSQLQARDKQHDQTRNAVRDGHLRHDRDPNAQLREVWSQSGQSQASPAQSSLVHAGVRQNGIGQNGRDQDSEARNVQPLSGERLNSQAPESLGQNGWTQNGQAQNGQAQNGQTLSAWSQSHEFQDGYSRTDGPKNGLSPTDLSRNDRAQRHPVQIDRRQNVSISQYAPADDVPTLIRDHRLDEASRVVTALLERRIAGGDSELDAARMLLQHYHIVLSRQPPLSHIGAIPLRPNDRLYACFDQFIDLIRQQQGQVAELQAIIAELI